MGMLNEEHPDAGRKPGEKIEFEGRTYTFGQNQFSSFWRAGPKDGTVICSRDFPHGSDCPYRSGVNVQRDFESAARYARKSARAEYERALAVVQRYEREDDDGKAS